MDPITIAAAWSFAKNVWKLACDNWQLILGGFLVVVVIAGYNHQINAAEERGAKRERDKADVARMEYAGKVKALEKTITTQHRQIELTTGARVERVRTVTVTNIVEVPKYVTAYSDSRCIVPTGFVLHHDSTVAGLAVNSTPAVELVDADSKIALSRVESVVTENYGRAYEWLAERDDCRARYTAAYESIERFKAGQKQIIGAPSQ